MSYLPNAVLGLFSQISVYSECELVVYIKLHLLFFLDSPQDGSAPKSCLCPYIILCNNFFKAYFNLLAIKKKKKDCGFN